MFAPDDAAAMLSDFGSVIDFNGLCVTGIIDHTMVSADDGSGFGAQRKIQVVRVVKGALGSWVRDDVITVDGVRWRLRELVDDARGIDDAYDVISVGRA
jgi:predicted DNA repair protein MutK